MGIRHRAPALDPGHQTRIGQWSAPAVTGQARGCHTQATWESLSLPLVALTCPLLWPAQSRQLACETCPGRYHVDG